MQQETEKQAQVVTSTVPFYALLACSVLACALLVTRVGLTHSVRYAFLLWNLGLAWIPYLLSLWITSLYRQPRRSAWHLLVATGLWLIFFPNAPYLVTDFVHLPAIGSTWDWFDLGLLLTFAWTGCFLAIASLQMVQARVAETAGTLAGWLFVVVVCTLSGYGMYLGRVVRWNSWDLLLSPVAVLVDIITPLLNPRGHPQVFAFALTFAAFFLVCYVSVAGLRGSAAPRDTRRAPAARRPTPLKPTRS